MANRQINLEMNEVPIKEMTVDVNLHITRMFRFRVWLGLHLINLLSHVWNCDVHINYVEDPSRINEWPK